jgi:branched-chain amino acid transport system ATP-binding protein
VLTVRDVRASYGGLEVLRGVSLEIPRGRVVTLLGANGAGKSTTLKVIAGLLRATGGAIEFDGRSIARERGDRLSDPVSRWSLRDVSCFSA